MTLIRLVLALLISLVASGCAGSLEAARARGVLTNPTASDGSVDAVAAAASEDHCRRLSRTESVLRYTSAGLAVLGGGSGLATIPADDGVQTGLAVTAGIAAVGAVTTGAIRAEVASDFTELCQ
jgi:hypothetical protein